MAVRLSTLKTTAIARGAWDATSAWADIHGDTPRTFEQFAATLNPIQRTATFELLALAYEHYTIAYRRTIRQRDDA